MKFVMILIMEWSIMGEVYSEIPCVYQFYGPKPYIDKLREVIDSLKTSGLV